MNKPPPPSSAYPSVKPPPPTPTEFPSENPSTPPPGKIKPQPPSQTPEEIAERKKLSAIKLSENTLSDIKLKKSVDPPPHTQEDEQLLKNINPCLGIIQQRFQDSDDIHTCLTKISNPEEPSAHGGDVKDTLRKLMRSIEDILTSKPKINVEEYVPERERMIEGLELTPQEKKAIDDNMELVTRSYTSELDAELNTLDDKKYMLTKKNIMDAWNNIINPSYYSSRYGIRYTDEYKQYIFLSNHRLIQLIKMIDIRDQNLAQKPAPPTGGFILGGCVALAQYKTVILIIVCILLLCVVFYNGYLTVPKSVYNSLPNYSSNLTL